jgi:hypothetical protein
MRMDAHKQKQLTARGWKVGNADEFLGLTPEEAAYIELKLGLSDHLKKQRQQRKLTQVELGKLLRSSVIAPQERATTSSDRQGSAAFPV